MSPLKPKENLSLYQSEAILLSTNLQFAHWGNISIFFRPKQKKNVNWLSLLPISSFFGLCPWCWSLHLFRRIDGIWWNIPTTFTVHCLSFFAPCLFSLWLPVVLVCASFVFILPKFSFYLLCPLPLFLLLARDWSLQLARFLLWMFYSLLVS